MSFRTLEDCIEKIIYNVGVLLVNEDMMEGDTSDLVCDIGVMFPRIYKDFNAFAGEEIAAAMS